MEEATVMREIRLWALEPDSGSDLKAV